MANDLELYTIESWEQFQLIFPVLDEGYSTPFNSAWQFMKGDSEDPAATAKFRWKLHSMIPGSQWLAVRNKEGTTIAVSQWVLHETSPFAKGIHVRPVSWWSNEYSRDITEQVMNARPKVLIKYTNRPHLALILCAVLPNYRRQGAGKLMMNWGRDLADQKGVESFIEATMEGVRLYESAGFTQIQSAVHDAKLPEKYEGEADKKAWLEARERLFPQPSPTMILWRPKGRDWKRGDELEY